MNTVSLADPELLPTQQHGEGTPTPATPPKATELWNLRLFKV